MSLKDKYDPHYHYRKGEEYLDAINKEEAEAWFSHPCTKALIQSLEGDFAGHVLVWVGGGYSNEESTDATVQMQAKARGQAQAIDDVLERIHEIRDIRIIGEEEDGIRD